MFNIVEKIIIPQNISENDLCYFEEKLKFHPNDEKYKAQVSLIKDILHVN